MVHELCRGIASRSPAGSRQQSLRRTLASLAPPPPPRWPSREATLEDRILLEEIGEARLVRVEDASADHGRLRFQSGGAAELGGLDRLGCLADAAHRLERSEEFVEADEARHKLRGAF